MNLKKMISVTLAPAVLLALTTCASGQTIINGVPFQGGSQPRAIFQSSETILPQMTEEQLAKPSLGANFYDTGAGIRVGSVFTNGPAQRAGLQTGDIVTKINGKDIQNVGSFNAMISEMNSGQSITLTQRMEGGEKEIAVSLLSMSEVQKASMVPEPGIYDQAIASGEQQLNVLRQRVKNAEMDLQELQKQLTERETNLQELKAKAEAAMEKSKAMEMEKMKMEKMKMEKMKMEKTGGDA